MSATLSLDDVLTRLGALPDAQRKAVTDEALRATANLRFIPNPGPQTEAWFSPADVLLYGGQGGGGKSGLLCGLPITLHQHSLLVRRKYDDLSALIDDMVRFLGTSAGLNRSPPPKIRTPDGRLIEFGAVNNAGAEESWQGRPRDFLGIDEACQIREKAVRFLMGWNRSTIPGQRCRTILASNPPMSAVGEWVVGMFRPWLDLTHPNPAKPGELRWFVTDPDGKDMEVGPEPVELDGRPLIPKSRTFIPARLADNPFLVNTGYQKELDALPEPIRSAVRDGNFMAARQDDEWQVIPSAWVRAAQARWTPQPPPGIPMCAMGVDVAQGGRDDTTLAPRHDGWFAPLITVPGKQTPYGRDVAGLIVAHRRDNATVIIDLGGGYGGAAYEHLKNNNPEFPIVGYKGAKVGNHRTKDRKLRLYNDRTTALWRFREALDPSQPGGSPIALPDDPILVADLTAPTFEVTAQGIKAKSKEAVCDDLGRSTDRGDAVIMSWFGGERALGNALRAPTSSSSQEQGRGDWGPSIGRAPRVILGREAARRNAGRA